MIRRILTFVVLLSLLVVPSLAERSRRATSKTGGGSGGGGSGGALTRIIVIPDTQKMMSVGWGGTPGMMRSAITWILNQNPDLVAIVGDVVQGGCLDGEGYDSAAVVYAPLIASTVPYVAVTGNHDGVAGGGCANVDSTFDLLFNVSDYQGHPWFGGYYGGGVNTANNFSFISADDGQEFIVIGLQFDPTAAHLAWAESLLVAYPSKTGIVINHDMMWDNGWSTNGLGVYNSLKDNTNLDFILAGHFDAYDMLEYPSSGQPHFQPGYGGSIITTMLANWQNDPLGGSGIIYIVDIDSGWKTITTKAYSPHFDSLLADSIGTSVGRPTGYTLEWTPYLGH